MVILRINHLFYRMKFSGDENKIKTFFHHPFPFFVRAVQIAVVSFPFFLVATFFYTLLDTTQMFLVYLGISAVFALIITYDGLIYFLDRIVVTNRRIIHVDWKNLFDRSETEADLNDIQDITTKEYGILSSLPIFDFGTFHVETSASKVAIIFHDAADPEGIKHFIYHLQQKPSRILNESLESTTNDRTYEEKSEQAGVGRIRSGRN